MGELAGGGAVAMKYEEEKNNKKYLPCKGPWLYLESIGQSANLSLPPKSRTLWFILVKFTAKYKSTMLGLKICGTKQMGYVSIMTDSTHSP